MLWNHGINLQQIIPTGDCILRQKTQSIKSGGVQDSFENYFALHAEVQAPGSEM